jgi:hypothetical protein
MEAVTEFEAYQITLTIISEHYSYWQSDVIAKKLQETKDQIGKNKLAVLGRPEDWRREGISL